MRDEFWSRAGDAVMGRAGRVGVNDQVVRIGADAAGSTGKHWLNQNSLNSTTRAGLRDEVTINEPQRL